MIDKHEELWTRLRENHYRLNRAIEENDIEAQKLATKELDEIYPQWTYDLVDHISEQLNNTLPLVERAEQQPNLAKCVLASMQELKDVGMWDGKPNSTYEKARQALESYLRMEKARVEYLAAKTRFEDISGDYINSACELGKNLALKGFNPWKGNHIDPLKWYLSTAEVIRNCKENGITVTLPTLRKYQSLELIPPPVRLGRKGYYSSLTVIRVLLINDLKKKHKLPTTKAESAYWQQLLNTVLRGMFKDYSDMFPPDHTISTQVIFSWMLHLTDEGYEDLAQRYSKAFDEIYQERVKGLTKVDDKPKIKRKGDSE